MLLNEWLILKQEIFLSLLIVGILILWLLKDFSNEFWIQLMNILLLVNVLAGFVDFNYGKLFGDTFQSTPLLLFEKTILGFAVWLISLFSYDWLRKMKNLPEFYVLLLTSLLGMYLMLSSSNLLLFYLGLEMSTLPLAGAANFDFGNRKSSESAMKLILSSAFSSAILLMGISWLYGLMGSLDYSVISTQIGHSPLSILAFLFILSGFAFKISAVPFHLWTADVYQGAPVAVTAFLSVVSKSAVLMVMIPFLYQTFEEKIDVWYPALIILAMASVIIANLFAIRQQNIKRLLAFSSIAQVGFLLIGLSAHTQTGATSVLFFLLIYLFSNLAAFGVVSVLSAEYGKENILDLSGLYKSHPFLSWVLALSLFSLAGIPPTAGFFGKFFLLLSGATGGNYWIIAIAAINMVISLYYYLRVVKTIFMNQAVHPIEARPLHFSVRLALVICLAGMLIIGFLGGFYEHIFQLLSGIN
jgi:NADH-quinone oxidoreductase subunit N